MDESVTRADALRWCIGSSDGRCYWRS